MMRRLSWVFAALVLAGCGGSGGDKAQTTHETAAASQPSPSDTATTPAPAAPVAVALATRSVACGCAIDGIGKCGNYVEIDGKYVKLANSSELGLGSMEWCGKKGVTAETGGEIRDGRFFAATLVVRAAGPTE